MGFVIIDEQEGVIRRSRDGLPPPIGREALFRLLFAILDLYRNLHTCTTNGAYLLELRVAILVSKEA